MKKKYFAFAALAGLLSLTACSGKSANEQAAEDAQKVKVEGLVPQLAGALANECSRNGIDLSCVAAKAKAVIKAYPPFIAAIAEYEKQCPQNYGAKMCAQGYAAYLADNVADKVESAVSARAKDSLKGKEEAARQAAAAEEAARAAAAAEEAARKRKEEEAARQAEEKMKADAEGAVDAVKPAEGGAAPETPKSE